MDAGDPDAASTTMHEATLTISPSTIGRMLKCEHLVLLERARREGLIDEADAPPREETLAMKKGLEHEEQVNIDWAVRVESEDGRVVDCAALADREARAQAARQAMRNGVELVVQAPLSGLGISGIADMLLRQPHPDGSERPYYEPVEIKSTAEPKPEHLLQAAAYALILEELQGVLPLRLHIVTGDGEQHTRSSRAAVAYLKRALPRLRELLTRPIDEIADVVPDPVPHCARCEWHAVWCHPRRDRADHLSLVAGMRGDQRAKLRDAGITTLADLATTELERVPRLAQSSFQALRRQAAQQHHARTTGELVPLLKHADGAGRGFARLPDPDPADVFFDFEGYPYFHDGESLEYLWGWTASEHPDGSGGLRFRGLWADDRRSERQALEQFLEELEARRAARPGMHVYHYAAYEVTQLWRLARRHDDLADRISELINAGVFVDLYPVVRQSLVAPTESYSIKALEPLYGWSREGAEVATAGDSIVQYEQWLETGDTAIRDAIIAYNKDDCDSTVALRDWLLERREEARAQGIEWPPAEQLPDRERRAPGEKAEEERSRREAAIVQITRMLDEREQRGEGADETTRVLTLLLRLLEWMSRVARQEWAMMWVGVHDTLEDYIDDAEAVGCLELVSDVPEKQSRLRTYRAMLQDHKLEAGMAAWDAERVRKIGTITDVREHGEQMEVDIVSGPSFVNAEPAEGPRALRAVRGRKEIPFGPLVSQVTGLALRVLHDLEVGADIFRPEAEGSAFLELLARRLPRVHDDERGLAPLDDVTPLDLVDVLEQLEQSTLVVQGPPGTGKTYSISRAVLQLAARGQRIGIMATSRSAVRNVLEGICEALDEEPERWKEAFGDRTPRIRYSASGREAIDDLPDRIRESGECDEPDSAFDVIGGTAWYFARPAVAGSFDVLVVDEAGQMSLFMLAAAAHAARSLMLVGDPQQLPQPSAVQHPDGAGRSPLEHIVGDRDLVEPARGVVLRTTWRMHPEICQLIGDAFYEGALRAAPGTELQRIDVPGDDLLTGAGLRWLPTAHSGNRTRSEEEADRVANIFERLLAGGATFTDRHGVTRPLTIDDILVVAPYNRQVGLLTQRLPAGARVGTVDRFQGREAPVAIWSMAASSRDDVPRGLEFLLSPNRVNVALSRAKALAIVVGSPALLDAGASTVDELLLVGTLCMLVEAGSAEA